MIYESEILVIGSGIAGLTYALEVSKYFSVNIITKKNTTESNTNYAQGGIASVFSKDDNFESHINDTLDAGAGLCNKDAVELIVKNGPKLINEFLSLGINFTLNKNGNLDLGREGGHSKNRIVHAKDLTGNELENFLLNLISKKQNIKIFENFVAIDLLTEHNLPLSHRNIVNKRNCWGVYCLEINSGIVHRFLSKKTILASGGLGQAYLFTTNPAIASGDGFAMAYRAGAELANMEFIQFHPTSLWEPNRSDKLYHRSFLISEAVRGKGAKLRLKDGQLFMNKYDPRGELASRDIVARAIDNELKRSGDDFVYLDITNLNKNDIIYYFPNIYNKCLKLNIDISKDYIPIVPAAHYACGGINTDLNGNTSINNLYAIGEVACTGVHGANRLASNSLLEALVFAKAAATHSIEDLKSSKGIPSTDIPEWDSSGTTNPDEKILISQTRKEIRQILWDYVGIVRSDDRLNRAKNRINLILDETTFLYKKLQLTEELIELRNLALVASLIIHSAILRKESRGLHYNLDYPNKDDKNFLRQTIIMNETI